MRLLAKLDRPALARARHAAKPWPNRLLRLALVVLTAAGILHFSGARTWPLELVHHFVPQYGLVAVGVAAASLLLQRRRQSAAAMLLAGCFGLVHWTASMPHPAHIEAAAAAPGETRAVEAAAESATRITLITNNIYVLNNRREDLMKWLASRPAEVIALQEVDGRMTDRLRAGEDGYPHRLVAEDTLVTRDGWSARESIVILSRYPILEHRLLQPWAKAWQVVLARLDVADGLRPWIVAIHAPTPIYKDSLPTRDLIFEKLDEVIAGLDGPVIVVGDFNASPYTPVYRGFTEVAGLATFRHFPASYPARLGGFGVPIDHVLARGARVAELHALPPIGSDHRPLAATLILRAEAP
jgi:endonuclease/exonuclease/phosphatase (EEP) superfamily protein YafD